MDSVERNENSSKCFIGKLALTVFLWIVVADCVASFFYERPWTADANYRDFDAYYWPAVLLRHGINPLREK